MVSYNNRIIVEAYITDKTLRATTDKGFARIEQKIQLKGLKVLIDAVISIGNQATRIPAGSVAYIKEELLHTQSWANKKLTCATMPGVEFIIVDTNHVEFISSPDWKPAA